MILTAASQYRGWTITRVRNTEAGTCHAYAEHPAGHFLNTVEYRGKTGPRKAMDELMPRLTACCQAQDRGEMIK